MDVVTLFIPDTQASVIEAPGKGRFHNVAAFPEPAVIFGSAFGDHGCYLALTQWPTNLLLCVAGTIGDCFLRTLTSITQVSHNVSVCAVALHFKAQAEYPRSILCSLGTPDSHSGAQ